MSLSRITIGCYTMSTGFFVMAVALLLEAAHIAWPGVIGAHAMVWAMIPGATLAACGAVIAGER